MSNHLLVFDRQGVLLAEYPIPAVHGLLFGCELSPGNIVLFHQRDDTSHQLTAEVLDVDSGLRRHLADDLTPVCQSINYTFEPRRMPAPGSTITQLFMDTDRTLVIQIDPRTGEQHLIYGRDVGAPSTDDKEDLN